MFKRLKEYTYLCPCNGHYKIWAYNEEIAKTYLHRCLNCEQKPNKLISVKLKRR